MKGKKMKNIFLLLIVCLSSLAVFAEDDVVLFDDDIIAGQIQFGTLTNDMAYEGSASILHSTDSTNYTATNLDIIGSTEIGSRTYLNMRVNFAADSPSTKIRYITLYSSTGTQYTYDPYYTSQFYVDGEPATIQASRVLFDDDPTTWQLMTFDISQAPGPMDTTQIRIVKIMFKDPVECYIDDVRVTSEPVADGVEDVTLFDDDIVQGQIQVGTLSSDMAYEGDYSIFHTTDSTNYTATNLDIIGSIEVGNRRYLSMRVNFAAESPTTKIRYITLYSSTGTQYTYDPYYTSQFYVDGLPATVQASRVVFDDDPTTWQLMTFDITDAPGPMDTTQLRIVKIMFRDPVDCYIDDVKVVAETETTPLDDVILYDDDVAVGQVQLATQSTDSVYEGENSLFHEDATTNYSVFKLDLVGSVEMDTRGYLNMWVNFAADSANNTIRYLKLYSSNGTAYTYDPSTTAKFYVDGRDATVSGSRIQFDNDPNTWQLLTLDMNNTPGPMDTTQMRIVQVTFKNPHKCYVDYVHVSETLPEFDVSITPQTVIFDDDLIQGQLEQYHGSVVTNMSYEGSSSIYLRGYAGYYEYIDINLLSSLDTYGQKYLKMWVNFDPDTSAPYPYMRRIQLFNSLGDYTYGPELPPIPKYYIDGEPVLSGHSRLVFDDDPSTWQQLALDISTWASWRDSQELLRIRVLTYDDVNLYVDYVTVESSLNVQSGIDGSGGVSDLKAIAANWLVDCNRVVTSVECE